MCIRDRPDCVKSKSKSFLTCINQIFISAINKVKYTFFADDRLNICIYSILFGIIIYVDIFFTGEVVWSFEIALYIY